MTNDINLETPKQEPCHCNGAQGPSLVFVVREGFPVVVGSRSSFPGFENINRLGHSLWPRSRKKHQLPSKTLPVFLIVLF